MDTKTIEDERRAIQEHLDRLGDTLDEVVATLRRDSERYKGLPVSALDCPVAHYVHEVSPGSRVGGTSVAFGVAPPWPVVNLPYPVSAFVAAFDGNPENYPELLWDDHPEYEGS